MHKGLDAADTKAYPEEKFGKATRNNVDRMLKICEAFSKYGASVDDKEALTIGQVETTAATTRIQRRGLGHLAGQLLPVSLPD